MPRRKKTGAKMLTIDEMGAKLNMSNEEMMVLVKNGIPHTKMPDKGQGEYYMFPDREVLATVSPLPERREPKLGTPELEDEEDEPIETVRPEPRPIPSMVTPEGPPPVATKPKPKPRPKPRTKTTKK